jgi:extradiol dioxygenase family protein
VRSRKDAFHLAIPVRDLDDAYEFYVAGLGCHLARRYADRITLDFFGDQLVCHLVPDLVVPEELALYPRHFGVTFADRADFDTLLRLIELRKLPVYRAPALRFGGLAEEHTTVVVRDPAANLLEFKHYADPRMIY